MRVLQSFATGPGATNPYLAQLLRHLAPEPEVIGFTWGHALAAPFDVLHVHWPEALLHGSTTVRRALRRHLFRALLVRLWLHRRRIAVVRTLHDPHGQGAGSRTERALLARLDRRTTLWIRLNPATPVPDGATVRTILHGDYLDWFEAVDGTEPVPGRLLYFGLIRPQKGVPNLVEAFGTLAAGPDGTAVSLRVVGTPTDTDVGAEVLLAALADERVTVSLGHPSDPELATEIAQAELVVLPYRDLFGSAASVLALSLGRPILVPANPATAALAAEVGPGWVFRYAGELCAAAFRDALAGCREHRPAVADRPDLSARAWPIVAGRHRAAYGAALLQLGAATAPRATGLHPVDVPPG